MDNRKCYFFFDGYYAVAAASDVLIKYHIRNRIVRTPVSLKNSCNFAVLIDSSDAEMSSYLLDRQNISVKEKEYV